MRRWSKLLLKFTLLHVIFVDGLNNLNQQHLSQSCNELANEQECLTYASCKWNGGGNCIDNDDPNFDKFKLLLALPLSERDAQGMRHVASSLSWHHSILGGFVAAIEDINARDGTVVSELFSLVCNFDFHYEIMDTQASPSLAAGDLTDGILQEGTLGEYDFILGGDRDELSVPLSIISSVHNIPMISPSSDRVDLEDKKTHPTFSRASPSNIALAEATAGYLSAMGYSQAALLYIDTSYGMLLKDALIMQSERLGIDLHPFASPESPTFLQSSQTVDSLGEALAGIVASQLNVIVCMVPIKSLQEVMTRARLAGLVEEGRLWIFPGAEDTKALDEIAASDTEFARMMSGQLRIVKAIPQIGKANFASLESRWSSLESLRQDLNSRLPGGVNSPPFVTNDGLTFEIGPELFASIAHVNPTTAFAYDATVAAATALCQADQEAINLDTREHGRAAQLHDQLQEVSFVGASGMFQLLSNTGSRDPVTVAFELLNSVYESTVNNSSSHPLSTTTIGAWSAENRTWSLDPSSIRYYPGNKQTAPLITNPIATKQLRISQPVKVLVYMLAGLVYLLVVCFISWVCKNFENPVVKASQPIFLLLVLVGVFLSNTAVIFLGDDLYYNTNKEFASSCHVAWWVWSLGTTISGSALVVKTYRVFKTFINPKLRIIKLRTVHLIVAILAFVLLDVVLLSLWTHSNPWKFKEVGMGPYDSFGRPNAVYAVCTSSSSGADEVAYAVVLLFFHLCLYSLGAFLSWKSRRVPTDFQEGYWIGLSFASQLQVLLFAIPTVAATQSSNVSVRFLVMALVILTINLVLLCSLFLPKVYRLRYGTPEVKVTLSERTPDNTAHVYSNPRFSRSSWESTPGEAITGSYV